MRLLFLLLIAGLFIPGCATTSAPVVADYGPPPENYEPTIKLYLGKSLKDPDSLKNLRISEPFHCSKGRGLIFGGGKIYAWCVDYSYNAKNSYGAYTGQKLHRIVYKQGRIIGAGVNNWRP